MLVRAASRAPSKHVRFVDTCRASRRHLQSGRPYRTIESSLIAFTNHTSTTSNVSLLVTKLDRKGISTSSTVKQDATAALGGPSPDSYPSFIPFQQKSSSFKPHKFGAVKNETQKRDALVILGIPELAIADKKKPIYRSNNAKTQGIIQMGFNGDKSELISTFVACAKGGQLSRAEVMLQHLTEIGTDAEPTPNEAAFGTINDINLLQAHNIFLEAQLDHAASLTDEAREKVLEKITIWYDSFMVEKSKLHGDALTFAILFQAASLDDVLKGQRKLRKHLKQWQDLNLGLLGDVLTESVLRESTIITLFQVCNIKAEDLHPEQQQLFEKHKRVVDPNSQVPEVLSTEVKGFGLRAVKESLRSFTDPDFMPTSIGFDTEEESFEFAEKRQKLLEDDAYDSAIRRWRDEHEATQELRGGNNPKLKPMLWEWHQAMLPLIQEELNRVAEAEEHPSPSNAERCQYGPYLRLLAPEKLAVITIMSILKLSNGGQVSEGMKTSSGVMSVGKAVEHEILAEEVRKRDTKLNTSTGEMRKFKAPELKSERDVVLFMSRMKHNQEKNMSQTPSQVELAIGRWSGKTLAKIGSLLTSMLLHAATVTVKVPRLHNDSSARPDEYVQHPAFYHTYQYVFGKRLGVIKVHTQLMTILGSEPLQASLISKQLPMLVKPRRWTDWNDGAYYFSPSRVMRAKDSREQTAYVKEASARGDLDDFYRGLDVLGATAWRINQKVFQVVLEVWNSGEKFADIPAQEKDEGIIIEPPIAADPLALYKWKQGVKEQMTERQNNHSQRCDVNFKMEIARAFYHEKFYFPHNVDFRGRAYPIPPHLNHMGNDLCRGILKFGEAKALGENGLRWLKIHLANLCGFDKANLADREQYTMTHLEDIYDSARNPLNGQRWWLKSEDPWQTLAACIEVEAALSSANPTAYECSLAVHQDGTCNGLQHYAALGGDEAGAKEVNLAPSDKPQDVYTGVAELVKESVRQDIEEGSEIAEQVLPHITRKVVKQTVMTNVYGVTFIGARAQVANRLKEIDEIPKERVGPLALYLTRKIFESLQTMFTGAHGIQTWFGECARRISRSVGPEQFTGLKLHSGDTISTTKTKRHLKVRGKAEFMSSVIWTTPLQLPVVQPYRHESTVQIKTNLQSISISDPNIINEVNSRKQMGAFPPNFVHSLDASHMLLCALECEKAGIAFAAVHDSFWTHPCDIDRMNGVLRDAFVKIHSENIIGRLKDEFETRYAGYKTIMSIPSTEPLAKEILALRKQLHAEKRLKSGGSSKRLTMSAVADLERELERDNLLASEDPVLRAYGEAMITPGSLVEKYGLTLNDDFDKVVSSGLGETPQGAPKAAAAIGKHTEEHTFEISNPGAMDEMHSVGEKGKASSTIIVEEPDDETAEAIKTAAKPMEDVQKMNAKGAGGRSFVLAWVDLKFPAVPEKGNFDVSKLKDSQYFFS